jgi:hypothetical protein
MRPFALLLLVGLTLWLAPAADPEVTRVVIKSFANDPLIVDGALERVRDGLHMRIKARFSNENLARTGVEALFFDRSGGRVDRAGRLRVVYLRQRVNPAGDPDIFMPVTKEIVIELPPSEGLEAITVLNVDRAFEDSSGNPRVHSFNVTDATRGERTQTDIAVKATPLASDRRLPPIANLVLTQEAFGGSIRYAVEFDVEVNAGSLRAEDVTTELYKQSLGDEPPAMADWLFVSIPLVTEGAAGGQGGKSQRLRFRATTEVPAGPRRTLVIANFVTDREPSDQWPFKVLPVR